jgi:hypothetical protein
VPFNDKRQFKTGIESFKIVELHNRDPGRLLLDAECRQDVHHQSRSGKTPRSAIHDDAKVSKDARGIPVDLRRIANKEALMPTLFALPYVCQNIFLNSKCSSMICSSMICTSIQCKKATRSLQESNRRLPGIASGSLHQSDQNETLVRPNSRHLSFVITPSSSSQAFRSPQAQVNTQSEVFRWLLESGKGNLPYFLTGRLPFPK